VPQHTTERTYGAALLATFLSAHLPAINTAIHYPIATTVILSNNTSIRAAVVKALGTAGKSSVITAFASTVISTLDVAFVQA
jgi:hypothetical protein